MRIKLFSNVVKLVIAKNKAIFNINQRQIYTSVYLTKQVWGSKKQNRKVKLHFTLNSMADPKIEEILAPLRANVKEQVCKKILLLLF